MCIDLLIKFPQSSWGMFLTLQQRGQGVTIFLTSCQRELEIRNFLWECAIYVKMIFVLEENSCLQGLFISKFKWILHSNRQNAILIESFDRYANLNWHFLGLISYFLSAMLPHWLDISSGHMTLKFLQSLHFQNCYFERAEFFLVQSAA